MAYNCVNNPSPSDKVTTGSYTTFSGELVLYNGQWAQNDTCYLQLKFGNGSQTTTTKKYSLGKPKDCLSVSNYSGPWDYQTIDGYGCLVYNFSQGLAPSLDNITYYDIIVSDGSREYVNQRVTLSGGGC